MRVVRLLASSAATIVIGCSLVTPLDDLRRGSNDAGDPGDVSLDTGPAPTNCDASETSAASGIFVSADGSDTTGSGLASAPFATITKGVASALQSASKDLYVAEGDYVESTGLLLTETAAGLRIHGGWKKTATAWSKDCTTGFVDRTVLTSATNVGVRVQFAVTSPAAEIDGLTIRTKAQGASPPDSGGESTYGVFVDANGALKMTNAQIVAGKGGDGGAASPQPAATTTVACDGINGCGTGAAVGDGTVGTPGSTATYAKDGVHPSDGGQGGTAPNGDNGAIGGGGTTSSCVTACVGQCQSSDSCLNGSSAQVTSSKGKCGCGGVGGTGGKPGHGGGAAIGAWVGPNAQLFIDYTRVVATGGGAGSIGGSGGAGALGGAGAPGVGVTCNKQCGRNGPVGGACACVFTQTMSLPGGNAGGAGSKGGTGGAGGSGAGGDAFGAVLFGGGTLVIPDAQRVVFAVGAAGSGGSRGTQITK